MIADQGGAALQFVAVAGAVGITRSEEGTIPTVLGEEGSETKRQVTKTDNFMLDFTNDRALRG